MEDDPVTLWIEGLKAGDEAAVADLWNRYFDRLVQLARQRSGHAHRACGGRRGCGGQRVSLPVRRCRTWSPGRD